MSTLVEKKIQVNRILTMKEEGVKIARRTVAKYREIMKILPSHLRKIK